MFSLRRPTPIRLFTCYLQIALNISVGDLVKFKVPDGTPFDRARVTNVELAEVRKAPDHIRRMGENYLIDEGPATMREIVVDVMPDYPLGYDVPELEEGERYRGSWWRKVVKPGLEAIEDVDKPAPSESNWSVPADAVGDRLAPGRS